MIEKECIICGTIFMAQKKSRKYCDKCQANSTRAERAMNLNYAKSRDRMEDDYNPVTVNCSVCGKEIQVPRKWEHRPNNFCSQKCTLKYKEEHKPVRIRTVEHSVCKFCGKEFEGQQTFCSQGCYKASLKERERNLKVCGDITINCKICGKEFIVHKDKPVYPETLPKCCSAECRKKASQMGGIMGSKIANKGREQRAAINARIKREEKIKDYKANGLCAYCKRSYTECERMQSEFRVKPKDALYKDGKIVRCPKFKG